MFIVHYKKHGNFYSEAVMYGPFAEYKAAEDFLAELGVIAKRDAFEEGFDKMDGFKYIERLQSPEKGIKWAHKVY